VRNSPDMQFYIETVCRPAIDDLAEGVIVKDIKAGTVGTAKWWSERANRARFSTRTEHTGKDGGAVKIAIDDGLTDHELRAMPYEELVKMRSSEETILAIRRERYTAATAGQDPARGIDNQPNGAGDREARP
jgi:hypothetical protein